MSELEKCPFCEKPFEIMEVNDGFMYKHESLECPIASWGENGANWMEKQSLIDALNTRPLESAARAEGYKEALEDVVAKFEPLIVEIEICTNTTGDVSEFAATDVIEMINQMLIAYEKGSDGNDK